MQTQVIILEASIPPSDTLEELSLIDGLSVVHGASGDFGPHNMTSNVLPTPFVASSDSPVIGGQPAYEAFDGTYSGTNKWIGDGGGVNYLQIDLGAASSVLLTYAIAENDEMGGNSGRAPKNWTMKGSNDGTNWTTVDTRTNQTAWGNSEIRTYACASPGSTAFRYYRLAITANNGDGTYTSFGELYLYSVAVNEPGGINGIGYGLYTPKGLAAYSEGLATGNPTNAPVWGDWQMFSDGVVGVSFEQEWDLNEVFSPTTYSLVTGALPDGLTLESVSGNEGRIYGTPTAAGTFNFTLRATNDYGTADQAFSITIVAPAGGGGGAYVFLA